MNFTLAEQVSFKCISYSEDTGLFYGLTMSFNKFTFHPTLDGVDWETFQCLENYTNDGNSNENVFYFIVVLWTLVLCQWKAVLSTARV